jgi:hypothetical protein
LAERDRDRSNQARSAAVLSCPVLSRRSMLVSSVLSALETTDAV